MWTMTGTLKTMAVEDVQRCYQKRTILKGITLMFEKKIETLVNKK